MPTTPCAIPGRRDCRNKRARVLGRAIPELQCPTPGWSANLPTTAVSPSVIPELLCPAPRVAQSLPGGTERSGPEGLSSAEDSNGHLCHSRVAVSPHGVEQAFMPAHKSRQSPGFSRCGYSARATAAQKQVNVRTVCRTGFSAPTRRRHAHWRVGPCPESRCPNCPV